MRWAKTYEKKGKRRSGRALWLLAGICLLLTLSACGASPAPENSPASTPAASAAALDPAEKTEISKEELSEKKDLTEGEDAMLQMMIGETAVSVSWEDNAAVAALRELCREKPLTIQMSMYGGFEQVGPLGTSLPRSDVRITTEAGDIVLYAGDQMVVFYGPNTWAYTRLGHITDRSAAEMEELLGQGAVSVTLRMEAEK